MQSRSIVYFLLCFLSVTHAWSADRGDEIRSEMWGTSDKSFHVLQVPAKWSDKSAVIIAQMNRFEYRKPVMRNLLRYNDYSHFRIKLQDKNAVAKYTERTFLPNREENWESIKVYVGFKIVKPDGKEIIIDATKAVKMEREYRGSKQSYYKLAVPNLEEGDILDYYICEETTRANANLIHFFAPVLYTLPQDYPVMNHKLQFRVERKCYINLRSLNGAPELKLVNDEANDEKFYMLEVSDMDAVEDVRWLFPYRELPAVKFRAAFAKDAAMRATDMLLGEAGEVKSGATEKEIVEMMRYMMSGRYDIGPLLKYAKKNLKDVTDPFEVATRAYYFQRNTVFYEMESNMFLGRSPWSSVSQTKFVDEFSTFLKSKLIEHDIILAVPRNVSALGDLLIENEIEWLIRVKKKGGQFLYLQPFDLNTVPGSLDALLQNTEAYAVDGIAAASRWELKKIQLPTTTSEENRVESVINIDLTSFDKTKISIRRTLSGRNKYPDQYYYLDPVDMRPEESKNFEMIASFSTYSKKDQAIKEAYLSKRGKEREEVLKMGLERDFDLKISEISNYRIEQTGRYAAAAAFIYTVDLTTDDFVHKAGQNYLMDIGKLIEQQTKVETHEMDRSNNIYYENPRSYKHTLEFAIPEGYQVQGLDKLNQSVENKIGGFSCKAKEVNGKVIIETLKHYDVYYAPKTEWENIVPFLNAAYNFNEQKLLFRKK